MIKLYKIKNTSRHWRKADVYINLEAISMIEVMSDRALLRLSHAEASISITKDEALELIHYLENQNMFNYDLKEMINNYE